MQFTLCSFWILLYFFTLTAIYCKSTSVQYTGIFSVRLVSKYVQSFWSLRLNLRYHNSAVVQFLSIHPV